MLLEAFGKGRDRVLDPSLLEFDHRDVSSFRCEKGDDTNL
jgi:hypothetical protein